MAGCRRRAMAHLTRQIKLVLGIIMTSFGVSLRGPRLAHVLTFLQIVAVIMSGQESQL